MDIRTDRALGILRAARASQSRGWRIELGARRRDESTREFSHRLLRCRRCGDDIAGSSSSNYENTSAANVTRGDSLQPIKPNFCRLPDEADGDCAWSNVGVRAVAE